MLRLSDIHKQYKTDSYTVDALKGISLGFRKNEFVSILGPSGCGKTTMLNIIGGLDRYSSGDLVIDGKSTKDFKDRDWDNYRNKKIGFVFQSYNLIPHLTILGNVELALTISGVGKKERKERAIAALKRVGLENEIKKRPNQLSGGQMQRVAIARALVNNPEILLADEPTGALDIKTSIEVMELIKEISKERLVIMVTHNGELAQKYSTRIINLLDGEVIGDSMPFSSEEEKTELEKTKQQEVIKETEQGGKKKKKKRSAMKFTTALSLSFKNLFSKRGRTILTSFAGSIGIIGIALVLSISTGFTSYINQLQSDALGGNPITVSTATIDYTKLASFEVENESSEGGDNNYITVYEGSFQKYVKYGHYNYISQNFVDYVKAFEQKDLEREENKKISLVQYNYYTPIKILVKQNDNSLKLTVNKNSLSILSGTGKGTFYESLSDEEFMMSQYDVIYQSENYSASDIYGLTLVVDKGNKLTTGILSDLGITPVVKPDGNYENLSFEDVCGKEFKLVYNNDYYTYDSANDKFSIIDESNQTALDELYNSERVKTLKITRVLRVKEDANAQILSSGVMYSSELAKEYRENCENSLIATKQKELKNSQEGQESFSFYAPLKIDITEFKGMPMIPESFPTTAVIVSFLEKSFSTSISQEEAYNLAMQQIGISSIPQSISFYTNSFDGKNEVKQMIQDYNKTVDSEAHEIVYSDNSDAMFSMLSSLVNTISYVLIAFAAISLVVSSIMIGIITYVSVIERTKEIGVLRSLGARKIDIVNVFNSETFIIGLFAGIIGGVISFILTFPINAIVGALVEGLGTISVLKLTHVLILTGISVILSLVSGLIPAQIASKKDPVVALRTE